MLQTVIMRRSYDAIAGIYDGLAKRFIGKALRDAQVYLVQHIPAGANILIVGGGTGWILEEMTKVHPNGLMIDYMDISSKMIAKAKRRNAGGNTVNFMHQSILDAGASGKYEVLITPFLLDNFGEKNMQSIFHSLDQQLNVNGRWLYADFQVKGRHRHIHKAALFVMYAFFRVMCAIEAKRLPDVNACFTRYRYQLAKSKTFRHQFITAAMYIKTA